MTATTTASPLFLHLLAERTGNPGALLLSAPGVAPEDVPQAALAELTAGMPCFYREGLDAGAAEALQQAGWQPLPAEALLRADAAFDPKTLPANVQWIEGDWFMAPPPKAVGAQAASRALALQLVQLVSNDADTHEIEALLRKDPTLSYHLLKLVNSLGMGSSRKVTSFSQAILILGRAQLRRWLNLMLFSSREGDMRSAMLLARVAVRAHALEHLCKAQGQDRVHQEQAFMAGMFSLLGVLFGMPLDEVLQPLSISDDVKQALLAHAGELGALLALLETAERGDATALSAQLALLGIEPATFHEILADASLWMQGVASGKAGSAHA